MKIVKKFIFLLILLSAMFFTAGTMYVKFYGKSAIENALTISLNRPFTAEGIAYEFPLGFLADQVNLEGLMKAERIDAQFNLWSLLGKKRIEVVYATVEKPVIKIKRNLSSSMAEGPSQTADPTEQGHARTRKNDFEIFVRKLFIEDGQVQYLQETAQNSFAVNFKDLQMNMESLLFPIKPQQTSFNFVAVAEQDMFPVKESKIGGSGWFDISRRDMLAHLIVREPDGRTALKADVMSKDNDLHFSGDIQIGRVIKPRERKERSKSPSVNDLIMDSFSTMGLEIGAKFYFDTKMDDFRVSTISFDGNVVAKPAGNIGSGPEHSDQVSADKKIAPE